MDKILLFDIDGTLAYADQGPSSATVEAVRKARRNGHKVFISTGRSFDYTPPAVAAIGFDGGIFSSGGNVMLGDRILAQHFIPRQRVDGIIRWLLDDSAFFILETPDGRINSSNGELILSQIDMSRVSETMQQFTRDFILDPTALPLSAYTGQPVYKIGYYSLDPSVSARLSGEVGRSLTVVPLDNLPGFPLAMGEISDPNITKGQALLELCQHLNTTAKDCIAFGDSMNDAEIIQIAGLGIAMGNAVPELKALADRTCDRCENDGVAKALHELKLI